MLLLLQHMFIYVNCLLTDILSILFPFYIFPSLSSSLLWAFLPNAHVFVGTTMNVFTDTHAHSPLLLNATVRVEREVMRYSILNDRKCSYSSVFTDCDCWVYVTSVLPGTFIGCVTVLF